ncbi:ig-like domain-containing protein [Trichonephila clavata]|uniref:Ig-like domain-containing protein n=1 Tax=Trichonephila clavata TaxID=2740835 RepID=A0A8X6HSQ2_TRICU|nr:ig-like domain-containing protein [Trichonephila clavata]
MMILEGYESLIFSSLATMRSFTQFSCRNRDKCHEVPQHQTTRMPPLRHTDGLLSSMLGLRFVVVPQHLKNGVLTLSCRAYISKAYLTTKSEIVATNKAKIADNHASN